MSVPIAARVKGLELSAIKEMAIRAARVEGVASLAWGLPSFRTPADIRAAVAAALVEDPDLGKYALPDGLAELRELVCRKHLAETGIDVDPERRILITAGNMQGVNMLLQTLLDPGDEVIVTDPGFASHLQQIRLCGGEVRFWPLDESRAWRLPVERLPDLVGPRTKAIILVSPSNPTGSIFPREALLEVGRVAREHGLLIIIDDPYSTMTYENQAAWFNLAVVPELADQLAYLFTFSKCYAMSGYRLGYAILPEALKSQAIKVHDSTLICAPRVSQVAGMAALSSATPPFQEFAEILGRRRRLICERLDAVAHVFSYVRPQGAYYVFPRILAPHRNSREFALRLLEQGRVSLTPGAAFGPGGEHHVRMAFCVDEATINTAFDRIERLYPA